MMDWSKFMRTRDGRKVATNRHPTDPRFMICTVDQYEIYGQTLRPYTWGVFRSSGAYINTETPHAMDIVGPWPMH